MWPSNHGQYSIDFKVQTCCPFVCNKPYLPLVNSPATLIFDSKIMILIGTLKKCQRFYINSSVQTQFVSEIPVNNKKSTFIAKA